MRPAGPPPGWPQRVRSVAFPVGVGEDRFEVYVDRTGTHHQINLRTLEVFSRDGEGWAALPWWGLPEDVQRRIWTLHEESC